ncbi:MAG: iron-containing alcohol dehydrogenase family protein [Oscillospiraceae bacterium]
MNWIYKQPVEILFGSGMISRIGELVGDAKRPLLVSDPFIVKSGLADSILKCIGGGDIFGKVSADPDVSEVNECAELLRAAGNDIIIALGGGSSLDLAKAASLKAADISEYHGTGKRIPEEHIPMIAVPTTAGTGSEVTCVSVLTDRRSGKKAPIVSESFYPKAALIDPELTLTAPPQVTASTGIDVLCHAVEGYWSRGHQPICDALAVYAIKTVFEYLPTAYAQPQNLQAREKLAEASVIAGLAFTLPKTTASHACSFPLTSIYHIPHGEACGLTLDYFARVNGADPRTAELAEILGYNSTEAFAEGIYELKNKLHLRTGLADMKLSDKEITELVRSSHHPNLDNNPIRITDDILTDMYTELSKK